MKVLITRESCQEAVNKLRAYLYKYTGKEERGEPPGFGQINDESLASLRARIDLERVQPAKDWEHEDRRLTRTRVRTAALCRDDQNPLYLDTAYAAKSPYGNIIAIPDALMMCEVINARSEGMPGMHALWQQLIFEWDHPIFAGQMLKGTTYLRDVEVRGSKFTGQRVLQRYETIGKNESGQVVGRYRTEWSRHPRRNEAGQTEREDRAGRPRPQYSTEDLERIKAAYVAHERRGDKPRFWEDVNEGDELPTIIKGPTNLGQRLAGELVGSGSFGHTGFISIGSGRDWGVPHMMVWDLWEKHPGIPIINSQGVPDHPFYIHLSDAVSQIYLGIAGGYDGGIQRIHWFVQLFADWQSDYAFMRKLAIQFRSMTILGETIFSKAKVKSKRIEDGEHIVEIEAWQEAWGDPKPVSTAQAEIVLPSRHGDVSAPVKSRI